MSATKTSILTLLSAVAVASCSSGTNTTTTMGSAGSGTMGGGGADTTTMSVGGSNTAATETDAREVANCAESRTQLRPDEPSGLGFSVADAQGQLGAEWNAIANWEQPIGAVSQPASGEVRLVLSLDRVAEDPVLVEGSGESDACSRHVEFNLTALVTTLDGALSELVALKVRAYSASDMQLEATLSVAELVGSYTISHREEDMEVAELVFLATVGGTSWTGQILGIFTARSASDASAPSTSQPILRW